MIKIKFFILAMLAALVTSVSAYAQSNGLKVVSGNPDLKVKLTRCEASGKTVVIDMVLENINPKDAEMSFHNTYIVAYDDEGNMYDYHNNIPRFSIAGQERSNYILPSDVPLKARLQIDGVPVSARVFKRIDIKWLCRLYGGNTWNDPDAKRIKITNLPIYREGE